MSEMSGGLLLSCRLIWTNQEKSSIPWPWLHYWHALVPDIVLTEISVVGQLHHARSITILVFTYKSNINFCPSFAGYLSYSVDTYQICRGNKSWYYIIILNICTFIEILSSKICESQKLTKTKIYLKNVAS